MKYLLFGTVFVFSLTSCVNEKYIYKCNTLYESQSNIATPTGGAPTSESHNLFAKTPDKGFKAIIKDKGDYLTIKPTGAPNFSTRVIPLKKAPTGWRAEIIGKKYFPEPDFDTINTPYKLKYFDTKFVLQALTIPLKVRPRLTSEALKDSFPSQTETSFNAGIAVGWKFTHNIYNSKMNILGQNTNRYSFAPGIFLGTGAVDLKKANTRNPIINFERKAAIITTGGFVMLGFNGINIGYSFGVDFATGNSSEQWLYQGKVWHGLIFAVDLLK